MKQKKIAQQVSLFKGMLGMIFVIMLIFGMLAIFQNELKRFAERGRVKATPGTYYVDMNCVEGCTTSITPGTCNDANVGTVITAPWCTIQKATNTVIAGSVVNVYEGHYNEGVSLSRSGIEGNPITFQAVGPNVFISPATNLLDEGYTRVEDPLHPLPTDPLYLYPNVYAYQLATIPTAVRQTHYADILVDDPGNPSYYFLKESDGPITLTNDQVTDIAMVDTLEGGWYWNAGTLYVHPYGHRVPSESTTGLWATRNALGLHVNANYNIVDGFKIYYAASNSGVIQIGSGKQFNTIRNLYSANGGLFVYGNYNTITNVRLTHSHFRNKGDGSEGGPWSWTKSNSGTGIKILGSDNVFRESEVFQNWNNMSTEMTTVNFIADRLSLHDAPNHCWQVLGANLTIRNTTVYNCQDDIGYIDGIASGTYENNTTNGGILFQDTGALSLANLTMRNNIHGACTINIGGTGVQSCAYEPTIRIENSLFLCSPGQEITIEHCTGPGEDGVVYTLAAYQEGCLAGTITGCMTLSNLTKVTGNYTDVIRGGRWVGDLPTSSAWDVHVASTSSTAYNTGIVSGAIDDFEGDVRSGTYDIGADEFSETDTTPPVITGVRARVQGASATVSWTTDEPSSSTVEYGTTTAYGLVLTEETMTQSHSVTVTGLTRKTLYHYRVKSMDVSGNEQISGDYTFTTKNQ